MNAKKVKLIRKLSQKVGLNADLQKKVYERLSETEKNQYVRDAKEHLSFLAFKEHQTRMEALNKANYEKRQKENTNNDR